MLNIDPREGETRDDAHLGMQELFLDVHLRNVSDRFDFDSVRFGIQPFSTDFRGFLFQDNQLGVRLFGTRDNNLWQYNLAWFRRLEKDTNSGLNDISDELREDDVVVANLYRQDFPFLGYHLPGDLRLQPQPRGRRRSALRRQRFPRAARRHFGTERGRDYDVHYLGYNGDGHFGPVNLTTSFYYALGDQPRNAFDDKSTDIRAWFLAGEASMDFDWIRVRASALYATGDDDPFDDTDEGFDAIFENPIFAGYDTSYFIRQAIPLIGGGGVQFTGRNWVLPSLQVVEGARSVQLHQSRCRALRARRRFRHPPGAAPLDQLQQAVLRRNRGPGAVAQPEAGRFRHRLGPVGGHHLPAVLYAEHRVAPLGRDSGPGPGLPRSLPGESFADEIPFSVLGNFVFTF